MTEAEELELLELENEEAALGAAPKQQVVEEMHPDISLKDRALYKNFAADPEAGFNFLQKQYPKLNFRKDKSGEILAKRPDEAAWKKLDPDTGFFSKDFLPDVLDVAWDVPAGLLESAATAAGGVGGALAGAPTIVGAAPGALAGAALAGGATGAGLETARQSLGKYFGVAEELDPSQIALSGAFGAASPLLLGTGATAGQIAKGALKSGTKEATKDLIGAQSGLLGRTWSGAKNTIAPKAAQIASGVDSDIIRYASQNLDKIKEAEKNFGISPIYGELRDEFINAAQKAKSGIGEAIGQSKEAMNVRIGADDVAKEYEGLLAKYTERAQRLGTKAAQEDLDYITNVIDQYVPPNIYSSEGLDAKTAFDLKGSLNEISGIKKTAKGPIDMRPGKLSEVERDLERVTKTALSKLDSNITKASPKGGELNELNKAYKQTLADSEAVNKYFGDEKATEKTINALIKSKSSSQRKEVYGLAEKLGIDVKGPARESVAINYFAQPAEDILSLGGTTSTSRTGALAGLGGALGFAAGGPIGGAIGGFAGAKAGSPANIRRVMQANARANAAGRMIQNMKVPGGAGLPQTAINTWQNLYQNER